MIIEQGIKGVFTKEIESFIKTFLDRLWKLGKLLLKRFMELNGHILSKNAAKQGPFSDQ